MKPRNHRRAIVAFCVYVAALLSIPSPARAEDIDIFTINPTISSQRPNVLIILDSSANWDSTDSVAGGKKFTHVAAAMVNTIGALTDQFNVGLMMYAETGNPNDNIDGGVMRAGVRQMTATNRQLLVDFFSSVDGGFDKSNNTSMGLAFYEAYLYFTGQTGYSGIGKAKRDFNSNLWVNTGASQQGAPQPMKDANDALWALAGNALTNSSSTVYNSPMTDACQKNFIIYIANGAVTDPNAANSDATTKLAAVGGAGATETILFTENTGNQGNISDEWTRWLAHNDISPTGFAGKQTIVTYTVEVNPLTNTQGLNNSELLESVATQGEGKYKAVTSAGGGAQIADALNEIFAEILAVNSVFASSTLPVSVNVRGTFLNQVYMGVFRPDANSSPRWPGNTKQFTLDADSSGNVFLVDKAGQPIENSSTGFISPSAVSFWSTASTFWDPVYYPDTVAQPAPVPPAVASPSDIPDGEFVEKGGAAQHLRTVHATDVATRRVYTCIGCTADAILSDGTHNFDTANASITPALLGVTGAITVSSLTRLGGTVTANTSTAHGFSSGQSVTIQGANETDYNVLTTVTVVDADTFTYSIVERPASPATAVTGQTLTAAKGSAPQAVTSIMLSGTTAIVTTPVAHGFIGGQSVIIAGATQAEYNGTYVISVIDATSFRYSITTGPATPTTLGNITVTRNDTTTVAKVISSMTRSGTTVTVSTSGNVFTGALSCSSVTITGADPTAYNVTSRTPCTKTSNSSLTFDFDASELTPTSSATGTITAAAGVSRTISSMTRPAGSGTVTVTTSVAHGFSTGDNITISGASDSLYNGTIAAPGITSTGLTTFTFTVTPQPPTSATGSIIATGGASVNRDDLINWVRGADVRVEDNPNPVATNVRGYLHGDVLHSRPAVINYNRAGQLANRDLVVYYGSNDGMLHAVKGGQHDLDGDEKWAFIPTEFYTALTRLYNQAPIISTSNPRTYFADGPISVDTVFVPDTSTPPIDRLEGVGARAQIYVGMRRGGRFYYSLDVTDPGAPGDPGAPMFKWKITNSTSGFSELGQTWSEARVAKLKLNSSECPSGGTAVVPAEAGKVICRVLVFGGGYDPAANDPDTQGTATMGRAIYVVDAIDGTLIWSAGAAATAGAHKHVPGMDFAIPADLSVINTDLDVQGLADRIYAADTGANIWRANISDPNPANWAVGQLASLGGSGANARKFLFAPDVVAFDSATDSVLVGSGDREKPFDTTIANRYYMIKDAHGLTALPASAVIESDLCDLTTNAIQADPTSAAAIDAQACLADAASKGWMIRLSTGEKTVTGSTTLGGTTIFATNTPASVSTPGSCTGSLGLALIYGVDFKNATATIDFNGDGVLSAGERNIERVGGGFPPTAIPFATEIGGNFYEGAITGTQVVQPPSSPIGQRYRVFWNLQVDN